MNKHDKHRPERLHRSEPAHLADPTDTRYDISYFAAPRHVSELIERFWVPRWSVPAGGVSRQSVLMYPGCVISVYPDDAYFYGVNTGLSTVELAGSGWVVGAKLRPGAARLMLQRSVSDITDQRWSLDAALQRDMTGDLDAIRAVMAPDPDDEGHQQRAVIMLADTLQLPTPCDDALLANSIVDTVELSEVDRVEQLADIHHMSVRTLQRFCREWLGLTPRWLVQRRRLQHAAAALKASPTTNITDIATECGYADHAHFSRDFRTVTGMSPSDYVNQLLRTAEP